MNINITSKGMIYTGFAVYGALSAWNYSQDNNERESWFTRGLGAATTDHIQDAFGLFGKEVKVDDREEGSSTEPSPMSSTAANMGSLSIQNTLVIESSPPEMPALSVAFTVGATSET